MAPTRPRARPAVSALRSISFGLNPASIRIAVPSCSTAQQFPRDPIGVEVTLNEEDARGGKIPAALGALINATRQLGLVYDNTIYMGSDVPSGQALLKVGKKLRK